MEELVVLAKFRQEIISRKFVKEKKGLKLTLKMSKNLKTVVFDAIFVQLPRNSIKRSDTLENELCCTFFQENVAGSK